MSHHPPAPEPDADSAEFWAGLRDGRLRLQRCRPCARVRFPPLGRCPYCRSPDADWEDVSGEGSLYAWTVVHRSPDPAFAGEVPYTVATVELREGPRLTVRLEHRGEPEHEAPVRAVFVRHPEWTELRMTPVAEAVDA